MSYNPKGFFIYAILDLIGNINADMFHVFIMHFFLVVIGTKNQYFKCIIFLLSLIILVNILIIVNGKFLFKKIFSY